jgi:hypothetical protein
MAGRDITHFSGLPVPKSLKSTWEPPIPRPRAKDSVRTLDILHSVEVWPAYPEVDVTAPYAKLTEARPGGAQFFIQPRFSR